MFTVSNALIFSQIQIIYKMDKFGQGVEFQYSRLPRNKDLSFAGFTKQMVLEMCILSGCDYLQSLPGMGLKRAHALIKKFTSYDKVKLSFMHASDCIHFRAIDQQLCFDFSKMYFIHSS